MTEVLIPTANLLANNLVNNVYMNLCIGFKKKNQNKLKPYYPSKPPPDLLFFFTFLFIV